MKKKEYVSPLLDVFETRLASPLLAGSGGSGTVNDPIDEEDE